MTAAPFLAFAQGQAPPPTGQPPQAPAGQGYVAPKDRTFVEKAASAGMFEVKSAQLALETSKDDQVKAMAQHLIQDHQAANDKLKNVAASEGIQLPTQLGPDDQAKLNQLKSKQGAAFDKAYLSQQKAAHQQAIELFQKEATTGQDPALKSFAEQTLPTLKKHETMLKQTKG